MAYDTDAQDGGGLSRPQGKGSPNGLQPNKTQAHAALGDKAFMRAHTHGRLGSLGRLGRLGSGPERRPSFSVLLYRYLFFTWLFKDVSRGNLLERAAAWRYNRSQAQWLPTYMRRWSCLGLVLIGFGSMLELAWHAPLLSAFFYVPGLLSFPVNTVIGVAWLGLKHWPAP